MDAFSNSPRVAVSLPVATSFGGNKFRCLNEREQDRIPMIDD
jgi:hypothetical protein